MLTFQDAAGNSLPAGVQVQIYSGSSIAPNASAVFTGYLDVGGTVDPSASLTNGSTYTASFIGTFAPLQTVSFTYSSGGQTLTLAQYQSPFLSQDNYAARQAQQWVRAAFGAEARQSGGVAYTLAYGLSYALANVSTQIQEVLQALRLCTAKGSSIDTWAADFFGNRLPRASGESDATYRSRISANLSAKKGLRSGILTIASFFGTAWINEPWYTAETGAWDTDGVFAWDTIGGWGSQDPLIQIFVEPNAGVSSSQMKSNLLAARAAGIDTQVISVTPGANGEGWGIGGFGSAHFGIQSQNDGVIL